MASTRSRKTTRRPTAASSSPRPTGGRPAPRPDGRRRRLIVTGAAVVAVALIVALVAWSLQRRNQAQATTAASAPASAMSAAVPPDASKDGLGIVADAGKAAANAPTLVEYQDYQCSACKIYNEFYGPAIRQLAQEGKIVFEVRTLTFLDTGLKNDSSKRAANAAACADLVGHYQQYYDAIYDNSPAEGTNFTENQLRVEWAAKAGITGQQLTTFQNCYDSRAMSGFVAQVDNGGLRANIAGTPTFLANGKEFDLSQAKRTPESVLAAITKAAG